MSESGIPDNGNIDLATVEGFGAEWAAFDQTRLGAREYQAAFDAYFGIFPFAELPEQAEGFDLGCGSGRWAAGVIKRVDILHCIDPSAQALAVAKSRLGDNQKARFHLAAADTIPLGDQTQDFGYALGVLHHVPDSRRALADCVRKLKPGAPFLVYLYYKLDNRPVWFRALWQGSDLLRRAISRLPFLARKAVTTGLAAVVYWPLSRSARFAEQLGLDVANIPLSAYRNSSFYTMRTDALDRFGTRLEQRFSRSEIEEMMHAAGLEDIRFSDRSPFWVACGRKRS
jgi:SAM-dependent methyltransferase